MREYHVLNLGAGVQSSVCFLMVKELQYAIFADTQEEPQGVYRTLEWLRKQRPEVKVLTPTAGKLGDHLMKGENSTGGRFASIPVFTLDGKGKKGRTRRQCTKEYKIEPIERAIRREIIGLAPRKWMPKDVRVYQYFGISTDEKSRALNIELRAKETYWSEAKFPLLDAGMSREDCSKWLRDYGVPFEIERSACVFCPYKSDSEWLRLKQHNPEGWARAVQLDRALRTPGLIVNRKKDSTMFLHRSCKPIAEVELEPSDQKNWDSECEGMCGN